ncbi:MAG: hypothetical protein LBQ79_09250 [Deltaproteobacteria bacterium]|jgi:hypothetical protein|nr:hypothetical protein [Deltaproteobacteria bacterium]
MTTEEMFRQDFEEARGSLNERTLRTFVGEMAQSAGYGGVTLVHRATGMARSTIKRGLEELRAVCEDPGSVLVPDRIRRVGGGRLPLTLHYPGLNEAIEGMLEPRGFPDGAFPPLKWTLDSTRKVSARLKAGGLDVSPSTARKQLRSLGYTLQSTSRHMLGVNQHPDGNAQFAFIADRVARELGRGNPVLSVESRRLLKDERPSFAGFGVRPYPESGRRWRVSRGIYELDGTPAPDGAPPGFEVATDRADSEFACHSIRGWWEAEGGGLFPEASSIYLISGRGGCSFSSRPLWQISVSQLAGRLKIPCSVSHFQPGTSRWDPVLVSRLFAFYSTGWAGDADSAFETAVSLISDSKASRLPRPSPCLLNHSGFRGERHWSPADRARAHMVPQEFRGDWNYILMPSGKSRALRAGGRPRPTASAAAHLTAEAAGEVMAEGLL